MKREIHKGRVYRHFKGDLYLVEDVCEHSETRDQLKCFFLKWIIRNIRTFCKGLDLNCRKLRARIKNRSSWSIIGV